MKKIILISIMIILSSFQYTQAQIIPELSTIKQLLDGKKEGQYIVVEGTISDIALKTGRLGSHYVQLDLTDTEVVEENGKKGMKKLTIHALMVFQPFVRWGDRVAVIGIFKHQGRFAGLLADDFVDTKMIMPACTNCLP